ncbi:hypothetical protein JKF63_01612 [Porcisia hertigi]|uniref:Uncharacterized protein n=1 Tax=Porcisia hertigi TaxID=2761500 RepID=A0A836IEM0_9TRYP|nr:hypothetical protein JKF63_01612 [Porcisia hertigi]
MSVQKAARIEASAPAAAPSTISVRAASGNDDSGLDDSELCNSINPLFIVSGPRGGVIDPRSSSDQLDALMDGVDDSAFQVLSDAWAAVGVPADRYWRSPQRLRGGSAEALPWKKMASSPLTSLGVRVPNALRLRSSFYPTRVEALAARGYGAHRGLIPLALDRRGGSGSKMFNVLPRWSAKVRGTNESAVDSSARIDHRSAVAEFISAIPRPQERNLYVLVDETSPVDPYFDLDFSYDPVHDGPSDALLVQSCGEGKEVGSVTAFSAAAVERVLLTLLTSLRREVENEFQTRVEECLVLTSSLQIGQRSNSPSAPVSLQQLKLSFHAHFRLADRAALESVQELHRFMARLRSRLREEENASAAPSSLDDSVGRSGEVRQASALLLRCVDFGVYTRWRAFRLPYNVKAPDGTGCSALASGAGDDLMVEQLRQLSIVLPDNEVGAAAPRVLHSLLLAADVEACKAQRYLVKHLEQHFRFFLPVLPGVTELTSAALSEFLSQLVPPQVRAAAAEMNGPSPSCPLARDVVSAWVMDLACIVRDASAFSSLPDDGEVQEAATSASFRLLRDSVSTAGSAAQGLAQTTSSPFEVRLPPMPRSVQVPVEDFETKKLLAEVFWCLAPEYGSPGAVVRTSQVTEVWSTLSATKPITPERIKAHYEDSIRAYYVSQKQNRYCIRLHRNHKATFAQLYLTFGSIKIRCYANDCCERCCVVPWESPQNTQSGPQYHTGYPKYERLAEIRNVLFPPLSTEELVRRYGTRVLQTV